MKRTTIILILLLTCKISSGQIQVKQVGSVHYTIIPSNEFVSQRNDSIANAINEFIKQSGLKDFPDVLLRIYDQNAESELSNFEEVLVYYQKYEGEFFHKVNKRFRFPNAHIGIDLILFDDHYKKGLMAIQFAIENFDKLKEKQKYFSEKQKMGLLTDEDLKSFELPS